MRRTFVFACALTVLGGLAAAPANAARTIHTDGLGVTRLGSYNLRAHPGFADAKSALGAPTRVVRPEHPGCVAYWRPLGLQILFENFGGGTSCASDGLTQTGTVRYGAGRKTWRTTRGLRVGDSLARLEALYPKAKRRPGARVVVYNVHSPFGTGRLDIITARISGGKVRALELWLGGAGD